MKTIHSPFSGIITAIVTPFQNGVIDINSFISIAQCQKNAGVSGIVIGGTTGESISLSISEIQQLFLSVYKLRDHNFKIYLATGSNHTEKTLETTSLIVDFLQQENKTIDGIMFVTPYYNKTTQAGLVAHFSYIFDTLKTKYGFLYPICLYNVPGRTGIDMQPATVHKLSQKFASIVAVKEATGILSRFIDYTNLVFPHDFQFLSGDDASFPFALLAGCTGCISVSSHIIPRTMVSILQAKQSGDLATLQQLATKSYFVNNTLFCEPNPIVVKYLLHKKGCIAHSDVRLPLLQFTGDQNTAAVDSILTYMDTHQLS
jgi:4-hydroxy-tetrahydrodipicolinate synthase